MSDIKIKREKGKVKFYVHETKPWGMPDENKVAEVSLNQNEPISILPTKKPYHYCGTEIFWIEERQQWIGFNFSSYQERSGGPNEEDYEGPYAILKELPPTQEELAKAKESGGIPLRLKDLYPNH